MPTISQFFGIVIRIYYDDHGPPHFHANYAGQDAQIAIETLAVMNGKLQRRALSLVVEWAIAHREELVDNWRRAESQSQDHVGLFTRSVRDIVLGLDSVAGFDPRDPGSVHQESPTYTAQLHSKVKGLKLGVLRRFLEGVDPEVHQAFNEALGIFAGIGMEIVDLDVPEIRYAAMTSTMLSAAESAGYNRHWFREKYHDFVPHVSRGLAAGMTITASEYLAVQCARYRIREALLAAFKSVDVIASPTTARVAPLLSEGLKGNGDDTRHAGYNQSNLLRFPSMLGLPACSLPCGADSKGLPIGVQLIGEWFGDQIVLNAACAYQNITDWHTRRPPVTGTAAP
jgi:Asp-tRNA(Asn)/Glu-tRNA(Gln) amidotransferase A subunit family amidase